MAESISNQTVRVCLCYLSCWNKNIYVLLQKIFHTCFFIFLFHQNFMRSAMPKNSEKILTLRKKIFNVIFKLLLFHQFFKLLSVFTAFMSFSKKIKNARIMHFLLKNSFFREVHFFREPHVSFAQFLLSW